MTTHTMTDAQMSWNLKKGFAWELPTNNGNLGDEFATRHHIYTWTPPTYDCNTDQIKEGHFISTD